MKRDTKNPNGRLALTFNIQVQSTLDKGYPTT